MSSFPWYVARSAGIVSWGLLALSVIWGLALSTRALGRRPRANWLLDLHRFLGGLAVVFVAIHLVGLLFDSWVEIGIRQVLVPFTSSWNPLAVSWGVVGLYLLVAIEVTSLLRGRIPKRWWKGVHLSSYGLYVVATIHMFTAGTDRGSEALVWTAIVTTGVIVFFTAYRVLGPGRAASVQGGRTSSPDRTAARASTARERIGAFPLAPSPSVPPPLAPPPLSGPLARTPSIGGPPPMSAPPSPPPTGPATVGPPPPVSAPPTGRPPTSPPIGPPGPQPPVF